MILRTSKIFKNIQFNNKSGVISVEAAILAPIIIFSIFILTTFIKLYTLYESIQIALFQTSNHIIYSEYKLQENSYKPNSNIAYNNKQDSEIKNLFYNFLYSSTNQNLSKYPVYSIIKNIELLINSYKEENYIDICAVYSLNLNLPFNFLSNIKLTNRSVIRNWVGKTQISNYKSIWDEEKLFRGTTIRKVVCEKIGGETLPNFFPEISKFSRETGKITTIHSHDLRNSYLNLLTFSKQLEQEINALNNFTGATHKNITINKNDIKQKEIIIVVPSNINEQHIKILEKYKLYANSLRIDMQIIEME